MSEDSSSSGSTVSDINLSHTTLARFLGDVLSEVTIIDETYDTAITSSSSDYDLGMTPDGEIVMSVEPVEDYYHSLEYGTVDPADVQREFWYVVTESGGQIHGPFDSAQGAQKRSAALNEQSSRTFYIREGDTLKDIHSDAESESGGESDADNSASSESSPGGSGEAAVTDSGPSTDSETDVADGSDGTSQDDIDESASGDENAESPPAN